jgi:hypothetical protein
MNSDAVQGYRQKIFYTEGARIEKIAAFKRRIRIKFIAVHIKGLKFPP